MPPCLPFIFKPFRIISLPSSFVMFPDIGIRRSPGPAYLTLLIKRPIPTESGVPLEQQAAVSDGQTLSLYLAITTPNPVIWLIAQVNLSKSGSPNTTLYLRSRRWQLDWDGGQTGPMPAGFITGCISFGLSDSLMKYG